MSTLEKFKPVSVDLYAVPPVPVTQTALFPANDTASKASPPGESTVFQPLELVVGKGGVGSAAGTPMAPKTLGAKNRLLVAALTAPSTEAMGLLGTDAAGTGLDAFPSFDAK